MQTYKIKVKEIFYAEYEVQANSESEAVENYTSHGEQLFHEFSDTEEGSIEVEPMETKGQ